MDGLDRTGGRISPGSVDGLPLIRIITPFYFLVRRKDLKERLIQSTIFVLATLLLLSLWSLYASTKMGRLVFISTQSSVVLLDGNNEYAIKTGSWSPEWA